MKSNVCKIEKGTNDLAAIFAESEKVAVYNGLNEKQTLQLRLLCEELDGMLPNIIDDFDGDLWFEFENGECKINVSFKLDVITAEKREELVNIAKDKRNSASVSIVGKIREAVESIFLDDAILTAISSSSGSFTAPSKYNDSMDSDFLWSLEQYRNSVKPEGQKEEWDELEKSVIASVADDVTVSIKGKTVDIVIVKKF